MVRFEVLEFMLLAMYLEVANTWDFYHVTSSVFWVRLLSKLRYKTVNDPMFVDEYLWYQLDPGAVPGSSTMQLKYISQ